ncbi:transposase [Clostridium senegalense]|uniref:transposase n=1 Tax=Clostridium senegalense TaxID=1465809 RepID=UPI0002893A5D|nr:transposase [Clostridium senegalense]
MGRYARKKAPHAIYHIIIKSVKDRLLFNCDDDKNMFMIKLKESQLKYPFKLYAFCLMDNHAHLLIDSQNQDISVIMKSLNLRYVKFYNKKYDLDSRLCKERFKSEMITTDEYLINASMYIHRNPKDLPGFLERPQDYVFSSMRVYLGGKDEFDVLDVDMILEIMCKNKRKARKEYKEVFEATMNQQISNFKDIKLKFKIKDEKFTNEKGILKPELSIKEITNFVAKGENLNPNEIFIKNRSRNQNARAMISLLATALCGKTCKEIAAILGNLTSSRVSQLGNKAIELVLTNNKYKMLFEKFINF